MILIIFLFGACLGRLSLCLLDSEGFGHLSDLLFLGPDLLLSRLHVDPCGLDPRPVLSSESHPVRFHAQLSLLTRGADLSVAHSLLLVFLGDLLLNLEAARYF